MAPTCVEPSFLNKIENFSSSYFYPFESIIKTKLKALVIDDFFDKFLPRAKEASFVDRPFGILEFFRNQSLILKGVR